MSELIERQAAIDAVNNAFDRETLLTGFVRSIAVRAIRDMPSVQPERKKGEWIEISSINHTYKCSECGRLLVNVADGRNNVSKHYPYCHCGADMRGEVRKMDDLISRRAALDAVEKNACNTQRIMDAVNNLPPAQPEPQEGHWINGKCDLCGEHAPFWCMASTYHESNYCPNCGAKMKGERQK